MLNIFKLEPAAQELLNEMLAQQTSQPADRDQLMQNVEEEGGATWIMTPEELQRYLANRQLV